MAYDVNFPADDSYLSDFPAGDREQNRALKDDQIVNAGKLRGLTVGNANGQIPINNGTENANLNAALLNGKASSAFATSNHSHSTATQSSNGYMSNSDKKKLDGIASGAEVNQNAFANVKVGSTTIQADAKQDTLTLAAGTNIALTPDGNNDKVTIGVTGKVASASQADSATEAGNINKGFQVNEENFHSSDFRQTILGRANFGICARPFCGKLPNNTAASSPGMAFGGLDTHGFIQLEYGTPSAYVGGGNANKINWYKKLAFTDSNVASATKATQDSDGNQINTTYLKRNQTKQNDMNACTVEGIYRFSGTLKNGWTSESWGTLLVLNNQYNGGSGVGGVYLVQLAFPTDNTIRMRQRVNTGAWTGWVTLARTSDNVASATKATQDKNGRDITGYLYKNEALSLNSNAPIVGSGTTIIPLLNALITKFKQIQGTSTYAENPPTTLKSLNDNKAPKASPAFSGTPTAPTPGTTDNSTRVATTNFVRNLLNSGSFGTISAASLNTNGYVKFSNGFIIQWGYMFKTSNSNAVFTYPITFSNKVLFADYSIKKKEEHQGEHSLGAVTNTSLTINMSQIFASYLYFLVIGY